MLVGDYRFEVVPDTEFRLDGGAMFGVVPRVLWERVCPPDELNRIRMNMSTAHTLDTQLNVFETFAPKLSEASKTAEFLFLANIQPTLQKQVREQCTNAQFVAMDTMNYWITSAKAELVETIKVVDCMIINDAEARQLTEEPNIHKAARKILDYGLKALVIKRGEYGAVLFTKEEFFVVPAYPLESVFDPTGAGDTFAGGFMLM